MRITMATDHGNPRRPNEDYASVVLPATGLGGAFLVLDGVTPPEGSDGCVHGVSWFTSRLGGAFLELSGTRRDLTLAECLAAAIVSTADAHRSTCDLSHPRTPQATVVAARWDDDRVEHLVLSDSVLLMERADGGLKPILDDRLDRLPEPVPSLHAALRAIPRQSPERLTAATEYGQAVEALRNTEGGFFTAAADPTVADHAVTGSTARGEVRALAALTDGASRWVEVFGRGDWADCFEVLRERGPQALIDEVRGAEDADPQGARFPRGKVHDDAAALYAEL